MQVTRSPEPECTTWLQRFQQSLTILCGGREPPEDLCRRWQDEVDNDLQDWVPKESLPPWATGIGTIEAAEAMANSPIESLDHAERPEPPDAVAPKGP